MDQSRRKERTETGEKRFLIKKKKKITSAQIRRTTQFDIGSVFKISWFIFSDCEGKSKKRRLFYKKNK